MSRDTFLTVFLICSSFLSMISREKPQCLRWVLCIPLSNLVYKNDELQLLAALKVLLGLELSCVQGWVDERDFGGHGAPLGFPREVGGVTVDFGVAQWH